MSIARRFFRGLFLQCPHCGSGSLFVSWHRLRDACPGCGLRLERDEGYFTGAIVTNYFIVVGWFVALLIAVLLLQDSVPLWTVLQVGSLVIAVVSPLVCYPFSKTLWLALDTSARPLQPEDFGDRSDPRAA